MKKITLFLICLLSLSFVGCININPKYLEFKSQPEVGFYSNEIIEKIKNKEEFSLEVFDTNFYKTFPVDKDDNIILYNFFNSINNKDYVEDTRETKKDLSNKEEFRLIVKFKEAKYIINVFDSELITIHPWDGNYSPDIINMKNVPLGYNLYDFCDYIRKD